MGDPPPTREDSRKTARPDEVMSTVTGDTLIVFRKKYHFPSDLVLRLPTKSERANLPPAGYFAVYEMSLQAGIRFPLPPELTAILSACEICLSQLSPRLVTVIMGLIVFFRERKSSLTIEVLSKICRFVTNSEGRVSCRCKLLDLRVKDPGKNWSGRFFFVENDWNLRERWGVLKDLPSSLHVGEEDILRLLGLPKFDDFRYEVRYLNKFLDEERLFKVGLSVQAGRSEALMLKRSSKEVSPLAKEATLKISRPAHPEDFHSPMKKKRSVAMPDMGKSLLVVSPPPEVSAKPQVPEEVLKRSCLGLLRANDLAARRMNLELELGDTLNNWNAEFVRIKYWFGEYKQSYQAKSKEVADLKHQLSGCRAELSALLSSFSAQGQEVDRARGEAMEMQAQASSLQKDFRALEVKVRALESENVRLSALVTEKEIEVDAQAVEDFKNSLEFKTIIQDHVQRDRDQIYDVEVKGLERQCYEEGFLRGFLKATRVVSRQTGADIEGISPSQASEDPPSDIEDEAESAPESTEEDVDVVTL